MTENKSPFETGTSRQLRYAEMALINCLHDRRSWADYIDIIDALLNLQRVSKHMDEETEYICGGSSSLNTKRELNA